MCLKGKREGSYVRLTACLRSGLIYVESKGAGGLVDGDVDGGG